jgi:putative membrane protein
MVTMMFWYGGHWAWWQGGLMWLGMILFWGVLIWAAYAVITNLTRRPSTSEGSGNDARRILDQRLAKGEISPEEYQRLRDLIGAGTQPAASGTGSGQ